MHLPRFANRLALLGALLLCISLGFGLALLLKERIGGTAEADPCFGHGQLVEKWQRAITQAEIEEMRKSGSPQMADVQPGLTEFRKCRSGPGFVVVIDDSAHIWDATQPSLEELESYYAEHPDEDPRNKVATSEARSRGEMSATPVLPDPTEMEEKILAGCDLSWQIREFPSAGLKLCYPADWRVLAEEAEVSIGNDISTMYFTDRGDHDLSPDCPEPARIPVSGGTALLCETRANLVEQGQGHSLILPDRRQVRYFVTNPTDDNNWLALRIALSAEDLP